MREKETRNWSTTAKTSTWGCLRKLRNARFNVENCFFVWLLMEWKMAKKQQSFRHNWLNGKLHQHARQSDVTCSSDSNKFLLYHTPCSKWIIISHYRSLQGVGLQFYKAHVAYDIQLKITELTKSQLQFFFRQFFGCATWRKVGERIQQETTFSRVQKSDQICWIDASKPRSSTELWL